MRSLTIISGLALVALAGCGNMPSRPSTQMTAPSAGSASAMPQSANSLPRGDTVNAPRASTTGQVGTTSIAR